MATTMKFKEIKDLSVSELKKKMQANGEEAFVAKMKNSMGQLANPLEIRFMRKDNARLQTAMTAQRKAGGATAKPAQKAAPAAKKTAAPKKVAKKVPAAAAAKKTK